jgi:DNA invertase Pin-like site-specific DNA recombinase
MILSDVISCWIGYCRGDERSRDIQRNHLKQAGCRVFIEDPDQSDALCPALQQNIKSGTALMVMSIDILKGTPATQLKWLHALLSDGSHLISLDGVMNSLSWPDTLPLIAVLRGHNSGAEKAPAGRPPGLSEKALSLSERAEALYQQKKLTSYQSARRLGIARSTYYRYLKLRNSPLKGQKDSGCKDP